MSLWNSLQKIQPIWAVPRFVRGCLSSLSENIQTVINIKDRNTRTACHERRLKETGFRGPFSADYDKERIARTYTPQPASKNLKFRFQIQLPSWKCTGWKHLKTCRYLAAGKRAPYKVWPLGGFTGQGDLVQLNLHEKLMVLMVLITGRLVQEVRDHPILYPVS